MITGILGVLATLLIGGAGLYFKYFRSSPSASATKQVQDVNHAMLQDAVNKPDDDAAIKRLHDGTA